MAGGGGGTGPPDFGRIEDTAGAPHYYLPTQIFRPCAVPIIVMEVSSFPIDKKQEKKKHQNSKFNLKIVGVKVQLNVYVTQMFVSRNLGSDAFGSRDNFFFSLSLS